MPRSLLRLLFLGAALSLAPVACQSGSGVAVSTERSSSSTSAVTTSPASSKAPSSASSVAAAALPPAPALPVARCTLRSPSWTPTDDSALALDDAGGAFAQLVSLKAVPIMSSFTAKPTPPSQAELLIPEGPARRFGMRLTTAEVALAGLVDAATLAVYSAKPYVVGDFAVVAPWTKLRVLDASAAGIEVAPDFESTIELTGAPAPRGERRGCEDLALSPASFEPATALPPARAPSKPAREAFLRPGEPIALALSPGGAAVARLRPKNVGAVQVLETKGAQARITWRGPALVFGWVASGDLIPEHSPRGSEGRMMAPEKLGSVAQVACDKDVALVAEIGGARATVGSIRAHARIEVLERAGGFARVSVRGSRVRMAPDARWLVLDADLAGCAAAPPEEESIRSRPADLRVPIGGAVIAP